MSSENETPKADRPTLVAVVAGTATADEQAAVEKAAAEPAVEARLALTRAAQGAMAETEARESADWSPGEIGYRRLLRDIEREGAAPHAATAGGWMDSAPLWRSVAAAAAIALIVVSVAPFGGGGGGGGQGGFEIATDGPDGALVQVTFAPGATEAEIRELLLRLGGRLADGPSALGVYRIAFADDAARDAALSALSSSAIVENAAAD